MSPRAAWRLESIGFTRVYDYVAGKADWGSFGLPLEGRRPSSTRVGAHVRTDVPACGSNAEVLAHHGLDVDGIVCAVHEIDRLTQPSSTQTTTVGYERHVP